MITTARQIMNLGNSPTVLNRRFKAFFGPPPAVTEILWYRIRDHLPEGRKRMHLLMGLHFLRNYNIEENNALVFFCDEKTFRKWSWIIIVALSKLDYVLFFNF